MLLEKYLPQYHYSTRHEMLISASPEKIFELADRLDLNGSPMIRFLFWLRGIPSHMRNRKDLQGGNFIELERTPSQEIIIGLIGQFWKANGNLQRFEADEFKSFQQPGFLKAVWNFQLIPQSATLTLLTTETRILCTDNVSRKRFSWYWFFIRPFSGIIRNEILKMIRKKAEQDVSG
jgi:hypothetical protein